MGSARQQLGQVIAEARRRANLTQGQVGTMAGVSAQQVSRWERGTAIPGRAATAKLAEGLSLDWRALNDLAIDAGHEETAETKRELSATRAELEATLVEVKRFVDQYQDFHAAYQRIGPQVDAMLSGMVELREEIAEIKRAVLSPQKQARR